MGEMAWAQENISHSPPLAVFPKSMLLIEDDLSLIQFVDSILLDHQYKELEWEYVTSGEKALDLIQRRAQASDEPPYSLIITDIFLEGEVTGFDVWLECQARFPEMPFVITSYLSFDRYFSILRGVNNCPVYLPKPLTVSQCQAVFDEYL